MFIKCQLEIIRLHQFIEDWLNGDIEKNEENFMQFSDVLAEDFIIIYPSGSVENKDKVTNDLWHGHGLKNNFSIAIKNIRYRFKSKSRCMMTYEEWQNDENPAARISSVCFSHHPENDTIVWYHLHETWLPE